MEGRNRDQPTGELHENPHCREPHNRIANEYIRLRSKCNLAKELMEGLFEVIIANRGAEDPDPEQKSVEL